MHKVPLVTPSPAWLAPAFPTLAASCPICGVLTDDLIQLFADQKKMLSELRKHQEHMLTLQVHVRQVANESTRIRHTLIDTLTAHPTCTQCGLRVGIGHAETTLVSAPNAARLVCGSCYALLAHAEDGMSHTPPRSATSNTLLAYTDYATITGSTPSPVR